MVRIPHNALVFVGDGRKALFLRNEGDEKFPNLRTELVCEDQNLSTSAQGSDRPGRLSQMSHAGQRSAVETTDWHDLGEHRFARHVAGVAEQIVRRGSTPAVILIAPPRTLAELRAAFHTDVRQRIVAELHKDLTKHPVHEIEAHLRELA